jgi:hypothetical protein
MSTHTEPTKDGDTRVVTTLKELMTLMRAGPLPEGVTASPALLEKMDETIKGPTTEGAIALFEELERKFPRNTLGEDKWYLVAVST